MNPMHKWFAFSFAYGGIRNLVYAPKMKENEYITDILCTYFAYTAASPILTPAFVLVDLKNIEHIIRKMPGKIDKRPWY